MNKYLVLMAACLVLLLSSTINIIDSLVKSQYVYAMFTLIPSCVFVFLAQFNYKKWKVKQ